MHGVAILRQIVVLLTLLTVMSSGSLQLATAKEALPFHGAFVTTSQVHGACGQGFWVKLTGDGNASHLGRTSFTKNPVSIRTAQPCPIGTIYTYQSTIELVAANGDTITMTGGGLVCEGPGGVVAEGTYSVAGGTGRFDGAAGTVYESFTRIGASIHATLTGSLSSPGSLS